MVVSVSLEGCYVSAPPSHFLWPRKEYVNNVILGPSKGILPQTGLQLELQRFTPLPTISGVHGHNPL